MSINLVAAVMQVLHPELVTKVAGGLGIERGAAHKAVSAAVPSVLGGFAQKAATPEGAAELATFLDSQTPVALDAAFLSGAAQAEVLQSGTKVLAQVLGVRATAALTSVLGQYTGIDPRKVEGLLAIIAPIVTAILASYQKIGLSNGGSVTKLLAGQKSTVEQALPNRFATLLQASAHELSYMPAMVSGSFAAASATAVASTVAAVIARPAGQDNASDARFSTAEVTAALKAMAAKPISAPANLAQAPVAVRTAHDTEDSAAAAVSANEPAAALEKTSPLMRGPAEEATVTVVTRPATPAAPSIAASQAKEAPPLTDSAKPVAPPPPVSRVQSTPADAQHPTSKPTTASKSVEDPLEQPIVERRRGVPAAVWLLPFLLLIAGAGWWWQSSIEVERVAIAAEQARRLSEQKAADAARLKAEAETVARIQADAAAARQKMEAEQAAAKAAEDARRTAEADRAAVAATSATADAEARRRAEEDAARVAAEADTKRRAEADAAAKKAADAAAQRKAEADAAAAVAAQVAAAAEAKRQSEARAAAIAAADADAKRKAATEAKSSATVTIAAASTAEKPALQVAACQKAVRDLAAMAKVQFDYASANIQDETPLVRLAAALKKCPAAHVRVEGHSDSNGDINRNQLLSEERAKKVAAFLVAAGLAADRVESKGYGETRPIALNDTESNRARNRRIEIVVE